MISTLSKTASGPAPLVAELLRTTPRRMTVFLAACIAAAILMAIVSFTTYTSIRGTVQTVGKDAAPSIVAAQQIQALLADADASGANAVLTKDPPNGPSWAQYRDDINKAHDQLVTASQNITYGNAERGPILMMESKLGEYEYLMGQTQGQAGGNGTNQVTAANGIFQQYIRPASNALDTTNYSHLSQTYQAHRNAIGWNFALVWLCMLLLLGVLVGTQVYLFRRMHRVINGGFTIATVIALFLLIYTAVVLNVGESQLVAAKQNSFDSVNALWNARAISYNMNADESLYLLHNSNNPALAQDEADYTHYAQQMTSVDPKQAVTDAENGQPFGGYLGQELANITYPGERQAAINAVKAWADYTGIDSQLRQLLGQGQYQQALMLDLGTQAGQSDYVFAQFDTAMGQVIAINQRYFTQQVNDAIGALQPFPYVLGVSLLTIILACVFGMKPRLEEYVF